MYIEKEFDWNSKLKLPQEIKKYSVDDYCVYIEPGKAQWCIIPNGIQDQVFNFLKSGLTIIEIFEKLVNDFKYEKKSAENLISKVIAEILDKNFFADFWFDDKNLKYKELKIFLTNNCNLQCQHCYRYNANTSLKELNSKDWASIIKQHAEMGGEAVLVSGGEPLLRKEILYNILKTSKKYNLKTVVLTNATLLDSEFIKNSKALLDEIQISLDGATAEVADKIRGKGNFDSVLKAIKALNKVKIKIFIAMTPLPSNIDSYMLHLSDLIKLINSISKNEVVFRLTRNIEDGRNIDKLTPLEQIEFENQIFELEDKVFGVGYNHLLN